MTGTHPLSRLVSPISSTYSPPPSPILVPPEGDYVDLSLNPERFTGYAGVSAARVWSAIYEENCFGQSESEHELSLMRDPPKAKEGTQSIPETMTDLLPGEEEGAQCLEKRVYYKVISGKFLCS